MNGKRIITVLACLAGFVASCPGQAPYVVTDLGDLGFGESRAYRINAAGEAVGWSSTIVDSHGVRHAFVHSGGAMIDLGSGTLGHEHSQAWGINDAGEVVGEAITAAGKNLPFLYSAGAMGTVMPFDGSTGVGYAINDANQVVGVAKIKVPVGPFELEYDHAFRWTDVNDDGLVDPGEVLEILPLNGSATSTSYARDVNAAGQVVGYSRAGASDHAFFFHDANGNGQVDANELVDLGTFGGSASSAYRINAAGQVVGGAQTAASKTHAFLWTDLDGDWALDAGEMADLDTLGGDNSRAHGINAAGHVVGYSQPTGGIESRAFLHKDGTMADLNERIHPASGWTLEEAWDINDSGQIVGFGKNPGNMTHGFLLTPATRGDFNLDGVVDGADYTIWADSYKQAGGWTDGDVTGNGFVDGADYTIWADNFTGPGDGPLVPEPAIAALLAGGVALIRRPRK